MVINVKMKKIILNTFISAIYYVVNLLLNLWITSALVASMGSDVYGLYPLANNICSWMVIITIAINGMLARHITISLSQNDLNKVNRYYTTAMAADLRIAAFLFIPIIFIILFADILFDIPIGYTRDVHIMFTFVFLTVPLDLLVTVFGVSYYAKDKLYLQNLARIIQCLAKTGAVYFLYSINSISLGLVGLSVFVADLIFSAIVIMNKIYIMPEAHFDKQFYDSKLLGEMFYSGAWSSFIQLGNALMMQCDIIVANICLGAGQSGIISLAATIPGAVVSIITLMDNLFFPGLLRCYATDGMGAAFIKDIQDAQIIVGGGISVFIVLIINLASEFYKLWLPGCNPQQLTYLTTIYLIPILASACFRVVGDALFVINDLKAQGTLTFVSGIINVFTMVILIKTFNLGVNIVVYTTCVILLLWYVLVLPYLVSKKTGIRRRDIYIVPVSVLMLCVALCIVNNYLVQHLFSASSWGALIIKGIFVGMVSIVLYILYYFVVKKALKTASIKEKS